MSDGLQAVSVEAPSRRSRWLLLFALPPVLGLVGRLIKGGWWLNDFDAVACGGWRLAHELPLYATGLACPGGRPAAYVYLPPVAQALAPLAYTPTVTGLRLVYGLAYAGLIAWLLYVQYGRTRLGRFSPIPLLVLVTGSSISCGNLAAPCHAMVLAAALLRRRRSALLIAAILLAGLVKPVFLCYALIFLLDDAPVRLRAQRILTTLALAAGLSALLVVRDGAALAEWRRSLDHVVFGWQTGVGFLDDVAHVGLRADQFATQALWVGFAGVLALAGIAFAETRRLDGPGRLALAIALAQLCNPRLMDYDLIMLGPGVVTIARWASPDLRQTLWRALIGMCGLFLVLNLAERTPLEIRLAPALLAAFVLAAAGLELRRRWLTSAVGGVSEATA